jgi:hypothetical protein
LRVERKKNKRGVLAGVVDPFHLWGRRGYIGKYLVKKERGVVGVEHQTHAVGMKTEFP